MAVAGATVRDALGGAVDAIAAAGSDTARLDAELLLAEAAGIDRARLIAEPEAELPSGAGREFAAMVRRRVGREPVAYILGRKGFRRIELRVDRRVLVPRPESELLVEVALELQPRQVLDVGTGSGAIALAIAEEIPGARVIGSDTSPDALAVARENAERLGLADRVGFADVSYPAALGPFDLVVANLPYVTEGEWTGLQPEITKFEPHDALVPGPTGMEAIEGLLADLARAGLPGAVALEHGAEQGEAVRGLAAAAGFSGAETRRDLAGLDRVTVARSTESRGG